MVSEQVADALKAHPAFSKCSWKPYGSEEIAGVGTVRFVVLDSVDFTQAGHSLDDFTVWKSAGWTAAGAPVCATDDLSGLPASIGT